MGNAVTPKTAIEWVGKYRLQHRKVWLPEEDADRLWKATANLASSQRLLDDVSTREHAYSVFTFQEHNSGGVSDGDVTPVRRHTSGELAKTPERPKVPQSPASPGFESVQKNALSPVSAAVYPSLSSMVRHVEMEDVPPMSLTEKQVVREELTLAQLPPVFDRLAIRLAEVFMQANVDQLIVIEKKLGPKRFRRELDLCRDCITTEIGSQATITRFLNAVNFEYKNQILTRTDFINAVKQGVELADTGIWEWRVAIHVDEQGKRKPAPPPGTREEEVLMRKDPRKFEPQRRKSIAEAIRQSEEEKARRLQEMEQASQDAEIERVNAREEVVKAQEEERKRRLNEVADVNEQARLQRRKSIDDAILLSEQERARRIAEATNNEVTAVAQPEKTREEVVQLQEQERQRRIAEMNAAVEEEKKERRRSIQLAKDMMELARVEKMEAMEQRKEGDSAESGSAEVTQESDVQLEVEEPNVVKEEVESEEPRQSVVQPEAEVATVVKEEETPVEVEEPQQQPDAQPEAEEATVVVKEETQPQTNENPTSNEKATNASESNANTTANTKSKSKRKRRNKKKRK